MFTEKELKLIKQAVENNLNHVNEKISDRILNKIKKINKPSTTTNEQP